MHIYTAFDSVQIDNKDQNNYINAYNYNHVQQITHNNNSHLPKMFQRMRNM